MNNNEIIKAIEQKQYDKIVTEFEPLIHKIIHRLNLYNRYPNDREDMMQVGRLAVWNCIQYYDQNETTFMTYAYQTVRNALFRFVKQNKMPMNKEFDETYGGLSEDVASNQNYADLLKLIRTHQHRDILYPYFVEGLTQDELADRLECSQTKVNVVIQSFRDELRKDGWR